MEFGASDTALVVIDPQNDVLSQTGVSWGLVGDSVKENNTVENLDRLFRTAKDGGYGVFISPHYLYPADQAWGFGGAVEKMMIEGKEFFRPDPLSLDGFKGSGADWLDRYKPYIEDGKTVVVSPHKVWGPQTNDLVLQLRKRRMQKVILAGMLANLCVESHLRELIEQGFEVAVVNDATAGPRHPVFGDGYKAAVVNFHFIANAVLTTDEAVSAMQQSALGQLIRRHGSVEDERHWCPDVAFREDGNKTAAGHAGANLGLVRRVAASLLQQDPARGSIKAKRLSAALDAGYLTQVLRGFTANTDALTLLASQSPVAPEDPAAAPEPSGSPRALWHPGPEFLSGDPDL